MDLEQVKTVDDFEKYLYNHPSQVVAEILQQAIQFFSQECRKEDGKKDWKAIKERKKMGMGFQLNDETEITAAIAQAFQLWVIIPPYGRNLGTSFLDTMTSHAIGKISNPRDEVHRILNFFIHKGGTT